MYNKFYESISRDHPVNYRKAERDALINAINIKTFSKFFGLASLRIGYLISNNNFIKLLDPYYNNKDITKTAVNCAYNSLNGLPA